MRRAANTETNDPSSSSWTESITENTTCRLVNNEVKNLIRNSGTSEEVTRQIKVAIDPLIQFDQFYDLMKNLRRERPHRWREETTLPEK